MAARSYSGLWVFTRCDKNFGDLNIMASLQNSWFRRILFLISNVWVMLNAFSISTERRPYFSNTRNNLVMGASYTAACNVDVGGFAPRRADNNPTEMQWYQQIDGICSGAVEGMSDWYKMTRKTIRLAYLLFARRWALVPKLYHLDAWCYVSRLHLK